MLTADLVRAYRRGDELHVRRLRPADHGELESLAERYLTIATAQVGQSRGELEEAWSSVRVSNRQHKLAAGLRKLLMDRCDFDVEDDCDPAALRRRLFSRAAEIRKGLGPGERFDVDMVKAEIANAEGVDVDTLTRRLYIDLRAAHRLLAVRMSSASELIAGYEVGQIQAVLLKATRVRAQVACRTPHEYRALFRQLKFHRLLYRIDEAPEGGYHLEIDGPFSLFRSVTKYGLRLALVLPAIMACDRWRIHADLLWGRERRELRFVHASSPQARGTSPRRASANAPTQGPDKAGPDKAGIDKAGPDKAGPGGASTDGPASGDSAPSAREHMPDEVAALYRRFSERQSKWRVQTTADILHLPGVGVCVPDLLFVHEDDSTSVYLEVMGFWSRSAVWKRVELVEAGLPQRILFAVSSRLRVSEAALDADLPGALYVYKGVMSAAEVERRLNRLSQTSEP